MTSQSIADDDTMTRQLWRDHVNNSLDVDLIHGDIHDRSCKETQYLLIHAPYTHIVVFWHMSNILSTCLVFTYLLFQW